jgi:hypothetical protein
VTTHENSAAMSLYGYGLTQYVVEFTLAYQQAMWGSYDGRTAGMFGEAVMAKPWNGVGTAAMARTHKAQEGASGWVRCSH